MLVFIPEKSLIWDPYELWARAQPQAGHSQVLVEREESGSPRVWDVSVSGVGGCSPRGQRQGEHRGHVCFGSASHVAEGRFLRQFVFCCFLLCRLRERRALSGPCFLLCEAMGLDHQERIPRSPSPTLLAAPLVNRPLSSCWLRDPSQYRAPNIAKQTMHQRGRSLRPPEEIIPKALSGERVVECSHSVMGPLTAAFLILCVLVSQSGGSLRQSLSLGVRLSLTRLCLPRVDVYGGTSQPLLPFLIPLRLAQVPQPQASAGHRLRWFALTMKQNPVHPFLWSLHPWRRGQ